MPTKILRKELKRLGVEERDLPDALKDKVIKRGKRGPVGQIVVKRVSGVVDNAASRTARTFEENVGGLGEIADKLEAIKPSLNKEQLVLLDLIRADPGKRKLARLLADSGAELTGIMSSFARGALILGQTEAIIEAARNLPRVMKDLALHALDGKKTCYVCCGSGTVAPKKGATRETKVCPLCRGEKEMIQSSKHKEFAVTKILEVGKMIEKGPMVQVNQQTAVVNNNSGGAGIAMEKIAMMADEILHGRVGPAFADEVIEGEVVK